MTASEHWSFITANPIKKLKISSHLPSKTHLKCWIGLFSNWMAEFNHSKHSLYLVLTKMSEERLEFSFRGNMGPSMIDFAYRDEHLKHKHIKSTNEQEILYRVLVNPETTFQHKMYSSHWKYSPKNANKKRPWPAKTHCKTTRKVLKPIKAKWSAEKVTNSS